MKIFIKTKIKLNPNIIDSFNIEELTNEIVEYAISCGYQFEPTTVLRYISFPSYQKQFKDTLEFKQMIIDSCKSDSYGLSDIYHSIYLNQPEEFLRLLDMDTSLLSKLDLSFLNSLNENEKERVLKFISDTYSPSVLDSSFLNESGILEFYFQKEKVPLLELIDHVDSSYLEKNTSAFQAAILMNPEDYLDELKEIETRSKTKKIPFYTKEFYQVCLNILSQRLGIGSSTQLEYILYYASDDQIPDEQTKEEIIKNPLTIMEAPQKAYLFKKEESQKIVENIMANKLVFKEPIPPIYCFYPSIFGAIVVNNPHLLTNPLNLQRLKPGYSGDDLFNLLQKCHYSLGKDTPSFLYHDDFPLLYRFLESNFSFSRYVDNHISLLKEQHQKIFNLFMDKKCDIRELEGNSFLQRNPYLVLYGISHGFSPDKIHFDQVEYYSDIYPDLNQYAVKNHFEIPDPLLFSGDIKIVDDKEVSVTLRSIENVRRAINIMEKKGIEDFSVKILLNYTEDWESIIQKNISYFKELQNSHFKVNFAYSIQDFLGPNIPLKQVLYEEEFLQKCVDDILSQSFSPLEQYIAIFDIVKNFKPYKKSKDSLTASRGIYEVLNNEYMVCMAYANLIVNLCDRVGIPCIWHELTSLDKMANSIGLHARNYVHIEDEKYHVSGFYVSDATWDNFLITGDDNLTYENFDYLLMTTTEARNDSQIIDHNDHYFVKETATIPTKNTTEYFNLERMIRRLDPIFYEKLKKLDPLKDEDNKKYQEYVDKKIDQPIEPSVLLNAIMEVKKRIYKNFNEDQFMDLKIWYAKTFFPASYHSSNAYDEECKNYILKRKEQLMNMTFEQIEKENRICDGDFLAEIINFYIQKLISTTDIWWGFNSLCFTSHTKEDYQKYLTDKVSLESRGLTCSFYQKKDRFETTIRMPELVKKPDMKVSDYLNSLFRQKHEFLEILNKNHEYSSVEKRGKS